MQRRCARQPIETIRRKRGTVVRETITVNGYRFTLYGKRPRHRQRIFEVRSKVRLLVGFALSPQGAKISILERMCFSYLESPCVDKSTPSSIFSQALESHSYNCAAFSKGALL